VDGRLPGLLARRAADADPQRGARPRGTPEWHPEFSRWLGVDYYGKSSDQKWADNPEPRVRTTRAFRKLRKKAVREFEVCYRIIILGEAIEGTCDWLNERAARNDIPLARATSTAPRSSPLRHERHAAAPRVRRRKVDPVVVRTQKRGEVARRAIFSAVDARWQRSMSAPTIRDIASETGYSIATVHRHVSILIAQGVLEGRGRTLRPGRP
jgi:hypothetical protein